MDLEQETKQFKRLAFAGLLFLVSAWFAYREVKFILWGRTADARVVDVRDTTTGRRRSPAIEVRYAFKDETGREVRESDVVPPDWTPPSEQSLQPAGQNLRVQFLPGAEGSSRLAGHRNNVALVVFFASLLALAFFAGKLWLEARQAVAEKRRSAGA